jgi:hypothetical protein
MIKVTSFIGLAFVAGGTAFGAKYKGQSAVCGLAMFLCCPLVVVGLFLPDLKTCRLREIRKLTHRRSDQGNAPRIENPNP